MLTRVILLEASLYDRGRTGELRVCVRVRSLCVRPRGAFLHRDGARSRSTTATAAGTGTVVSTPRHAGSRVRHRGRGLHTEEEGTETVREWDWESQRDSKSANCHLL